nr:immunoglobulin light chain junction region [Macaca mulatta]
DYYCQTWDTDTVLF